MFKVVYRRVSHICRLLKKNQVINVNRSFSLSLVLLVGSPRSGTSWLNREICRDDKTFEFLPECTLITKQVELYNNILHYCDRQRFSAYFRNQKNLLAYFQDNIVRMLNLVVKINQASEAKMLVLKDPELSLYLHEAQNLFPLHKLIVLLRDPRDVLSSMKNVTMKKNIAWDINKATSDIFTYYHQIESYKPSAKKNCLFVRYEDLVVNGLGEVRAFLDQPDNSSLTSVFQINVVKQMADQADPFFSEFYLQSTTRERIGDYKKTLSDTEISHIDSVFSGVIKRWGY